MKYILAFLMFFSFQLSFSQQIESRKYGFSFPASERQRKNATSINGFIDDVHRVELVRILPDCRIDTIYNDTNDLWRLGKVCRMNSAVYFRNSDNGYGGGWVIEKLIGQRTALLETDFEQVFKGLYCTTGEYFASPCYEPRHGIYFYGENDCVLGFTEICFTCNRITDLDLPCFVSCSEDGFRILLELFRKYSMIKAGEE